MTESMAIFSMPGTSGFFQVCGPAISISPGEVYNESGFVFAPFDSTLENIYRIPGSPKPIELDGLPEPNWIKSNRKGSQTDQSDYRSMFDQAIDAIKKGHPEKIVISVRELEQKRIDSMPDFLLSLRESYTRAFIFLFYIPGQELWVGASPELLLDTQYPEQRTVALAGTLQDAPDLEQWTGKERMEHRFVEQFIEEIIATRAFRKEGPRPVKAGPVYHLKSDYSIPMLDRAVNPFDLHPGPALSGYPVDSAIETILRIETSPRRYYTGFLGPVWNQEKSRLFINLRCLEVLSQHNILYAGGGLTIDSNVQNEWLEIQDKLSTLRSKIHKGQQKT